MTASEHPRRKKGLLQFEIIDEQGWQWSVLHLAPDSSSSSPSQNLVCSELSHEARRKVNDRRNRFSWTSDGRRDIDDKKVWVVLESPRAVVQDQESGKGASELEPEPARVLDISLFS